MNYIELLYLMTTANHLQESSSIAIELDEAEVSSLLATKNKYGMGQTCRNPGTLMFTPKYLINGFSSPQVLGPIGFKPYYN
jgi:hypothetical protein